MAFLARNATIGVFRNDPLICTIRVDVPEGDTIDLSASPMSFAIGYPTDCAANQYPNVTPRQQILEVFETPTQGAEGVYILGTGTWEVGDETRPYVDLVVTVSKANIQALPISNENRATTILTYDFQVNDVTWLYGDFAIKESAGA